MIGRGLRNKVADAGVYWLSYRYDHFHLLSANIALLSQAPIIFRVRCHNYGTINIIQVCIIGT